MAVVAAVVVVSLPGPGPGPRPGPASYADPSEVFGLSEAALPFLPLPLSVSGLREFGPEAVRRQAPLAAVVSVAAAGTSAWSPGARTARLRAAVGAHAIRQRHTC